MYNFTSNKTYSVYKNTIDPNKLELILSYTDLINNSDIEGEAPFIDLDEVKELCKFVEGKEYDNIIIQNISKCSADLDEIKRNFKDTASILTAMGVQEVDLKKILTDGTEYIMIY